MSLPDRTTRAQRLARTYGGERDGWERVTEFQRVQRWRGRHPELKSHPASRALDLPRSRIRPWFNGAKPDPVHAVETADINGWLDAEPGDPVFEALSVLHAWVLAGGSILAENYVPRFAVDDSDPEALLRSALDVVGAGATVARSAEPSRATELRPASDAPTLGRFLVSVLDAPLGEKIDGGATIPEWVTAAPFETKLRWSRVYVSLRSIPTGQTERGHHIREERRSPGYWRALAAVFRAVVGPDVTISVRENSVYLDKRAVAMLDVTPELPE